MYASPYYILLIRSNTRLNKDPENTQYTKSAVRAMAQLLVVFTLEPK